MAVRYLGGGVSFEQKDVSQEFSEASSGSSLAGLTDVDISNPTNGDTLVYNSTTEKWENGECGGGSSTLAGLTDVDISEPADGQTLVYNATSGKWENGAASDGGILIVRGSQVGGDFVLDHTYAEIAAAAPAVALMGQYQGVYTVDWLSGYGQVDDAYNVGFGEVTFIAQDENDYPVQESA